MEPYFLTVSVKPYPGKSSSVSIRVVAEAVMQGVCARQARLGKIAVTLRRSGALSNPRLLFPLRAASTDTPATEKAKQVWDVQLLYDGECPLCLKEIAMLRNKDNGQNKISFVDIATPDYDPDEYSGVSYGKAMGRIHGILPDGKVIEGVEVFRRCYEAVGLGWVYAMTSMKPVERLVNVFYDIWAAARLPLTGRSKEGIAEMKYWNTPPSDCEDEEYCEMPWGEEEEEDRNE